MTKPIFIEVDHLDAPTHIRNEFNQIVWSWNNREAFGYIEPNEDVDGNGTYFEFNLRFPGQWFDKETGLFHNGFRDYNPSTGRYMQSDPLGLEAGFNTYAYVGNNPYRAVDPYGLESEFISHDLFVLNYRHGKSGKPANFEVGHITTSKGREVLVLKNVGGFKGSSQNCHGFALDLPYWVQDPTMIYEDDYEQVEYSKATHTLFRSRFTGDPNHSGLNHRYNGPEDMSFGKWGSTPTRVNMQSDLEILYKPTYYRKKK